MSDVKEMKRDLLEARYAYQPFEYPEAYEFWEKAILSYWNWTEVNMNGDIKDWAYNLTEEEREIIAGILKGFTSIECIVGDYWAAKVAQWFPKPEVAAMAHTFSCFETIHAKAYHYLNESLGLEDFDVFMQDPVAAAKLEYLIGINNKEKVSPLDMAISLATFSGFAEGVSLYSSFAILQSFSINNKLKGVGKIIEWSIRDEAQHSNAGCWLFKTFISEHHEIDRDVLRERVYEAARAVVQLEHNFLGQVFQNGRVQLSNVKYEDIKEFIKYQANSKLQELGYDSIFEVDESKADNINSWFFGLSTAVRQQDFFAGQETSYARGVVNFGLGELDWDVA